MKRRVHIAIDGTVAAGKGSVASQVAHKLNILYFDTGAMYRAVALLARRNQCDLEDIACLSTLIDAHTIIQSPDTSGIGTQVFIDTEDVSQIIREDDISSGSSVVAKHPEVRKRLVAIQQQVAQEQSVVMEGRDISTVVLPDAQVKVFLTASIQERARRRHNELLKKGVDISFETVLEETKKRDYRDSHREASPLTKHKDAVEIDTTNLTIQEVVDTIVTLAKPHIQ